MTNSWQDMQNTACFMIAGSNCAENHPIAMRWINKARAKGAKVIVVDPRFTRTASQADIFAQIRPGTDIAYLGAIVKYIIDNKEYDDFYLKNFTNAYYKVSKEFKFDDGMFSGFNEKTKKYDTKSWGYQLDEERKAIIADRLDDPDTVFSKVKEHYSRYTMALAEQISGIPADKITLIAKTFCKHRPGSFLYALGMTQHTTAVQGIRAYAVIQLLLGNIGKAGGSIQALRGEPNVQGSTDMANLIGNLPGYIPYPTNAQKSLSDFQIKHGSAQYKPMVALLKAWFGANATAENDYCYDLLPKTNPANSPTFVQMYEKMGEQFKLVFSFGSNSLISIPDCSMVGPAYDRLEMFVCADIFETETAQFWRRPGIDPKDCQTEVIFLPAAFVYEKAGSITNSSRLIQWKEVALPPLNDCLPDLDIIDEVFRTMRDLYAGSTDPKDATILKARWDYGPVADPLKVLHELNGYDETTGELLPNLAGYLNGEIGTVSTGVWQYAGVTGGGINRAAQRGAPDTTGLGLDRNFCYSWPGNIRILYNRASCDEKGQPLDPNRALIWWDEAKGEWVGNDGADVPDKTKGPDTPEGRQAFRFNPEGKGRIFAAAYTSYPDATAAIPIRSAGMTVDGPLPEFYEPIESPTENAMHPNVAKNPCAPVISESIGSVDEYPYVLTTYGVTEHFCAGGITRNIPFLNEIMPEPFAEMSKNLGRKLGIQDGDKVEVSSARGKITVRALVTDRLQTYKVNGKEQETIGMPWSWGFASLNPGPSTNFMTMASLDPGAGTPEYKCCLVNVRRA